jgi:heptosyltransferase III
MRLNRILISRIDAIGDVTLTLPLCGYIKTLFPQSEIFFLGRNYTKAVIETCSVVDHFVDYNMLTALSEVEQIKFVQDLSLDTCIHVFPNRYLASLFKKARIPFRIGTTNRWFHWFTCNKLVRLSRKRSNLHEAELNIRLLKAIGETTFPDKASLYSYYHFDRIVTLPDTIISILSAEKFNLVLHPKSHGSGKEWPLIRYKELIDLLPDERFNIIISGSEKEKATLKEWIPSLEKHVTDISGLMSLEQLIAFISKSDGLIASGTGPLHLAAASGIHTLGLFPDTKPIHAERWGPIGKKAEYIEGANAELDIISASEVYQNVKEWPKN